MNFFAKIICESNCANVVCKINSIHRKVGYGQSSFQQSKRHI